MKEKKTIDCGAGRELIVEGEDLSAAFDAARQKTGASGAALAEAVRAAEPGRVRKLAHMKEGKLDDGAGGAAAVQIFDDAGRLTFLVHYAGGQPSDAGSEPCMQQFNASGAVISQSHFINGRLNDAANGEAAVIRTEYNGDIVHEHFTNGTRNDSAAGDAAVQVFRDGALLRAERFTRGQVNDGPNGEPGNQRFGKDGTPVLTEHWNHGTLTKTSASGFKYFIKTRILHRRPF